MTLCFAFCNLYIFFIYLFYFARLNFFIYMTMFGILLLVGLDVASLNRYASMTASRFAICASYFLIYIFWFCSLEPSCSYDLMLCILWFVYFNFAHLNCVVPLWPCASCFVIGIFQFCSLEPLCSNDLMLRVLYSSILLPWTFAFIWPSISRFLTDA